MRSLTVVGLGLAVAAVLASAGPAHAQGGWTDSGTNVHLTTGTDRVGIGTTTPTAKLHVTGTTRIDGVLQSNRLSSLGGSALRLRLRGEDALRLEPTAGSPNIIGGSAANTVHPGVMGATIGGGGAEHETEMLENVVTDDFGTVGGGRGNRAGDAAGTTNGNFFATVGGGERNTASGARSTVGGGLSNEANGSESFVGGGGENQASETGSVVAGGQQNNATGSSSTVGGGANNTASGTQSTVPGGSGNTASGFVSFAAGRNATAAHSGAFVWADASQPDFASEANNQFRVRSSGGAQFASAVDPTTGAATAGVTLAPGGGSWMNISDRNVKDNVTPLDGRQILRRLSVIPITQWNLKAQDPAIKHVGPMAQDFYAAFGLGENERYINSADADGVALVSIQALYEMVMALEQKTAAVDRKADELERKTADLERIATGLEELRARLARFEQAAQMHR